MRDDAPAADDDISVEAAFVALEQAIAALPMPFSVFDANDRLLACSDSYRGQYGALLADPDKSLLTHPVYFEQLLRARKYAEFPPEEAEKRCATELRRHRTRENYILDVNSKGKWTRRTKSLSPEGQVVSLAMPIDELIQKSRALSEAKQQLEHLAFHDPLTGLPNRRGLSEHLEKLARIPEGEAFNVAVLHVDLDKFKLVNDTLGHDAGDSVLLAAAKNLQAEVRATDFVARVGGDEFVVVCHRIKDEDGISGVAQRIVDTMAVPIPYREDMCQIGASIGIAITGAHNISEHVLMDADIALYEAKNNGRGCFEFFYPTFRDRYSSLQRRINEVRDAITLNAFEPHYQPQICARTGDVIGFEALARWSDRERGIRPPGDFMQALEEARLTNALDDMILRKTLQTIGDWDEEGVTVPRITLNMSEARLNQDKLVDRIKWAVESEGLTPDRIGLEILETVVVGDGGDLVSKNLRHLADAGFTIALDDFGTGNASIAGLRNLSIKRIKIDRSFVMDIDKDRELQVITGAMIGLIKNLNLEAVCEGVETAAEAETLRNLGADAFQGFLFSKAMPADMVPIWLESYEEDRAPALRTA